MLHTLEMKHFSRRGKTFFTLDNELTIDTSGLKKKLLYSSVSFTSYSFVTVYKAYYMVYQKFCGIV